MPESYPERKPNQPTKMAVFARFGAVAAAAAAFAVPAAEAGSFDQSASGASDTYLPAKTHYAEASPPGNLTPKGMRAVREGAKVLLEMHDNIRPDVVSSAVVELDAGTFLAYGPRKGSPGETIPKGKVAFMEFPQLAVVDGRIKARGLLNTGTIDDKTVNALDSRWVDIKSNTVHFYYLQTMDANKDYPAVILVRPGEGNNLASGAEWFQEPPGDMQLAFLTSNFPAKYAISQKKYWAVDPKPGRKPNISDIKKSPST